MSLVPLTVLLALAPVPQPPGGPPRQDDVTHGVEIGSDLLFDHRSITSNVPPTFAGPHTIFTNFDGQQLGGGSHSSQGNTTGRGACVGEFPAFGENGPKRAATIQATRQDWEAFGMTITDQRPASGNYTMVMVGSWSSCCGGGGVAPVICGTSNLNAIAFSCQGSGSSLGAGAQAGVISQEAAHTFGLMHVNDRDEVMNPSISPSSDPTFKDACYSYSPGSCSSQRTFCPGGEQNSFQELLSFFGPGVPDTQAPVVVLTTPVDGEVFEAGADFDIIADASDDVSVKHVVLWVNGDAFPAIATPPYTWNVTNIPEGTYEMYAVAEDLATNQTESATITISVGGSAPPPDTGADDAAEDGTAGEDGSSGSSGDEAGSGLPPGFGDTGTDGCGCRSPALGSHWAATLMLVVGVRRRRPAPG